jgi:hypothetical protein
MIPVADRLAWNYSVANSKESHSYKFPLHRDTNLPSNTSKVLLQNKINFFWKPVEANSENLQLLRFTMHHGTCFECVSGWLRPQCMLLMPQCLIFTKYKLFVPTSWPTPRSCSHWYSPSTMVHVAKASEAELPHRCFTEWIETIWLNLVAYSKKLQPFIFTICTMVHAMSASEAN